MNICKIIGHKYEVVATSVNKINLPQAQNGDELDALKRVEVIAHCNRCGKLKFTEAGISRIILSF